MYVLCMLYMHDMSTLLPPRKRQSSQSQTAAVSLLITASHGDLAKSKAPNSQSRVAAGESAAFSTRSPRTPERRSFHLTTLVCNAFALIVPPPFILALRLFSLLVFALFCFLFPFIPSTVRSPFGPLPSDMTTDSTSISFRFLFSQSLSKPLH